MVYLDDVIAFDADPMVNEKTVRALFEGLRNNKIKLSLEGWSGRHLCEFFVRPSEQVSALMKLPTHPEISSRSAP